MAKNTGRGHRNGAIRGRTQVYNHRVGRWIKRDSRTGQLIDVKSDNDPFKGVRKEK